MYQQEIGFKINDKLKEFKFFKRKNGVCHFILDISNISNGFARNAKPVKVDVKLNSVSIIKPKNLTTFKDTNQFVGKGELINHRIKNDIIHFVLANYTWGIEESDVIEFIYYYENKEAVKRNIKLSTIINKIDENR
jgi:hypothetical protein